MWLGFVKFLAKDNPNRSARKGALALKISEAWLFFAFEPDNSYLHGTK